MEFIIDNLNFKVETENKIKNQSLTKVLDDEVCEYLLNVEFEETVSPKPYSLWWEEKQIDMIGFWSSKASLTHNIRPDWDMRTEESRTASGMPLMSIYNKQNTNRVTVALEDAATPTILQAGVVEENATVGFKITFFAQRCPEMSSYSTKIRFDRRNIPVTKSIASVKQWWGDETYIPDSAKMPMYSCWYSFHQHTIPDEILEECKIAKLLGMNTVIVDDGWQTDDNSRGYAYCGDWKICEKKIPDMEKFVYDIHELGMKIMFWFSVPFVGIHSENYEKFKGKYLWHNKRSGASVLDIRFKEVREFLVNIYVDYVKKYGWDGLKLDFIDSFRLTEESSTDYENMDTVSVEVALERLLEEATTKLKEINPDILIEFRQSYVGPIVSKYGNLLRVTDCPNDAILNRVHCLDLRLTSGKNAVHSDMIMWHKEDTNESVMYQLLAVMFGVPQISVRFDNITLEHKKLLKNFLAFWISNRDVLLDGELTVSNIDANYTMAKSEKDGIGVAVLYQNVPLELENDVTYVFNSTGKDYIYLESNTERQYTIYDYFGTETVSGAVTQGVNKISVNNCYSVKIV
ncbi:MAG: alpha-galactosidase [Clostridia bacterium]|nr:alpha-galactosidase [Clostridia bacterium]